MFMATEDDECDSSNLCATASQSDVNAFLHAQVERIIGLNSNLSDDDDSDDESLAINSHFASVSQSSSQSSNKHRRSRKSNLSHSCFASISLSSTHTKCQSDDLTELKWLNTFKLKDFHDPQNKFLQEQDVRKTNKYDEPIGKLLNELKTYNYENFDEKSISYGVLIFLAFYSKRHDQETPWLLTTKQILEHTQAHAKQITNRRAWKDSLKQSLTDISCFVPTKQATLKSRSAWTIDSYYRPLLTRAYLTGLASQSNKTTSTSETDVKQIALIPSHASESMIDNFAPKSTVKTKVLPRLYERLCNQQTDTTDDDDDEFKLNSIEKLQYEPISGHKRARSISVSSQRRSMKNKGEKRLSLSSPWTTKLTNRNKTNSDIESKLSSAKTESTIVTPCPSKDHTYLDPIAKETSDRSHRISSEENDECDSNSLASAGNNDSNQRQKCSLPRKRSSLKLQLHRPNTRISRKIIQEDLELLRQATHNLRAVDLADQLPIKESIKQHSKTSVDGVLDLSLSYM